MNLSEREVVKRPALLQRLTGLNVKEFEKILEAFGEQYEKLVIQPRVNAPGRQRALGGGQKGAMPEMADKLLLSSFIRRSIPCSLSRGCFLGWRKARHANG